MKIGGLQLLKKRFDRGSVYNLIVKTKLTRLFVEFFESEQASGVFLILCTITSIVIANSFFGTNYLDFWHTQVGFEMGGLALRQSVEQWINDGLMAVFFLLIGLEIERELYVGELSDIRNATLPIFAAVGGMVIPVLIHFLLNRGTETQAGAAVPMATDIAFALGALALLGSKIPVSLKIFLTALAIIDDLGAIVVIALFYGYGFSLLYLVLALGIFAGLLIISRRGVRRLAFYLIPGLVMWYFMFQSGIHPTIAGVLLAFAIPFAGGAEDSPSHKLQHFLHKPAAFIILPLFALANTSVTLTGNVLESLASVNSLGIMAGLSKLPGDVFWRHILGAGFLGGIGFTMSIFITLLAFGVPEIVQSSKIAILLSSLMAGTAGFLILNRQTAASSDTPA